MGKHEAPPFRMMVDRGRLVPATEYDAERLDTWRNGTKVNVVFVRQGSRVMEKKWWAVLNRAVKECKTPWNTSAEASEAIKLALGIVNLSKTVAGAWLQYPKSLTELSDPELDDAVRQMIDVIYHVTGVNPEEWRKQIADIGEDESQSDAPTSEGSDGSPQAPSPETVAADNSLSQESGEEAGEPEADHGGAAAPASDLDPVKRMLMEECIDNMLRDAFSDPAIDRPAKVDKLRDVFLEKQNLGDFPDFVNRCHETARRVIGKPGERDRAKEYLLGKIP